MKPFDKKKTNNIFTSFAALVVGILWTFSSVTADSLLVGSLDTDSVLQYNGTSGTFISNFASGGGLSAPHAMIIGPDNNLYVGSRGNDSIIRYDSATGNLIDIFVTSGNGGLTNTHGMAFGTDGNLYVCSQDTNEVLRYDGTTGAFIDIFATDPLLLGPYDLEFGPDGKLYVSSVDNNAVLRFDETTGAFVDVFTSGGTLDGSTGIHFGPDDNLYVASYFSDSVLRFDGLTGIYIDDFVAAGSGGLAGGPIDLAFGPDGNLFVSSLLDDAVFHFDGTTGAFIDIFVQPGSGGMGMPTFLLFVADPPPPPASPQIAVTTGGQEFHINVEGADYIDSNGTLFVADKPYTSGDFGYVGGSTGTFTSPVSSTEDDLLYQTMRGGSSFSYNFDAVSSGDYKVTLYFMEPFWTTTGDRLMDVAIENTNVLSSYDIVAAAGSSYAARAEFFVSNVSDGQLNVDFTGVYRGALISAVSIESRNLDFGNPVIGAFSDRIVTISNNGTGNLDISSLSTSNPDFAILSPAAPATVLPGSTQDVTVRFSPTLIGDQAGSLDIISNDANEGSLSITLTGTSPLNEPDINVTPVSLAFGEVIPGSTSTGIVTIDNLGLQTLTVNSLSTTNPNFTILSPAVPFNVAAGGSQQVALEFAPVVIGTETGNLDINSNDPNESAVSVPLSGSGVATLARAMNIGGADYTDTGGTLYLADTPYIAGSYGYISTNGGVATYTETISGTVEQALYQNLRGGNFSYVFDSLAPGSYDVTLHFMESYWTSAGQRLFNVDMEGIQVLGSFDIFATAGGQFAAYAQTFTVNVSDGQLNVDFTGVLRNALLSAIVVTPSQPEPDIDSNSTSLDFGSITVNTTADTTVTLSNVGTQTLSVSSLSVTDTTYSIVSPAAPFDIIAGGTQDVIVRFSPTTEATTTASLDVTSNDPDENPYSIALTGTGTAVPLNEPDISVDTTSVNFGSVLVDSTLDSTVIITNIGTQTLTVSDLTTTGSAFSLVGPVAPVSLLSGDSQIITIRFSPTITGSEAGSLNIVSDDPDTGTVYISLSGSGAIATLTGLNIGGTADYSDGNGTVFSADQVYTSGSFGYIASDGGVATYTQAIAGTTDDALYQSVRAGSSFSYIYDNMTPGQYSVTLHFMESFWNSTGERLFNVDIEGVQVLTNFDIFAAAGATFTAYSQTFAVDIVDGQLNVDFTGVYRFAMVAGITITELGVPLAPTTYSNVAGSVGLVLSHDLGSICNPVIGSGSAWADYDGDNDIDLFVTNRGGANRLYRNDGDTNGDGLPDFVNEAAAKGVDDPTGAGHGTVFVDYDNDGDQDLFIANWSSNKLYQNQLQETGVATFIDVTATAGVADFGRTTTPSFADYDGDGNLDLYLTKHKECVSNDNNRDTLYHSNGDGTFTDVTGQLCPDGVANCQQVLGLGFAPAWVDFDNDGDMDLYLVNDNINGAYSPNVLWRNDGSDGVGGWLFTDISTTSGTSISLNGMGAGIGDYDNDGWMDIAFSNIGDNWLLRNLGDGTFMDNSANAGIQRAVFPNGERSVTWGTSFFDYNNDGWLDLYFVAGETALFSYAQPNVFFENNGDGTFRDISIASGLDDPGRGRNSSTADFDGDGYVDVFVGNYGTAPSLYHNNSVAQGNVNNWLTITVEGTVSNKDGIGTRLSLTTADGITQIREINSGAAHGGGNYRAAYFGMGQYTTGELSVRWPTGITQVIGTVTSNQAIKLVE